MLHITQPVMDQITDTFNSRKKAIGLSGYTVGEMIGQGGTANVYRLSGHAGSPDYVLRISEEVKSPYSNDIFNMREMEILRELKRYGQPHVVQYLDAFVVDIPGCPRYYCAVMKRLIPLNKYRLAGDGTEIAVRLGSDLLPLLQSFADKEIIHRDIKPENIFYDGSFRNPSGFLLGDFGIAKRDTETSVTPTGTESTVSPEVRGLDRTITQDRSRADMYSLGIVMYRYLNEGVYPSNRERVDKMPPDKNPFPEPRYGSKRLKALVVKATSYNPADRFESPQAMLRELQHCEEYGQYMEQRSMSSQPTVIPSSKTSVSGGFSPAANSYAPYSQHQGAGMNPVSPVRKNAGGSLLKNKPLVISCVSAVAVLLVIVLLVAIRNSDVVEIAGEEYHRNSEKSYSFSDVTLTVQDCKNIAQSNALATLRFEGCRFESGAFRELSGVTPRLERLQVKSCTGIDDCTALSSMTSLKDLTLSDCLLTDQLLSAVSFEKYTQLASVDLSGNAELSDISCLKPASGTLKDLIVSGTSVKNFTVLSGGSILHLTAENCALTDSDLGKLPDAGLLELNLSYNKITDISSLKKYSEITRLYLAHNKISDAAPLSRCVKLKSLSLAHNSLPDIAALSVCKELSDINVSYNRLKGLEGLEQAIYLKEIRAAHNRIVSIDGLTNCTLLTIADLSSNQLSDISLLSKSAETLNTVFLDNNRLTDIAALKNTAKLRYFSADANELKSLAPLTQSTALYAVSANNNAVTSLEPLCDAKDLRYLYLSHNKIKAVPDRFCYLEDLYTVDLSDNDITNGHILTQSYSTFDVLALQENPIREVGSVSSHKASTLIITYHENMDFGRIKGSCYTYLILDCPLDKQVKVENDLGAGVRFATPEQAAEKVEKNYVLRPEQ